MDTTTKRIADAWRIPDELWVRIEPLLPKWRRRRKGGRPPLPARQVMDGLYYVLRTGCQWKAVPPSLARAAPCTAISRSGESGGSSANSGEPGFGSTTTGRASNGSGKAWMVR